MKRLGFAVWGIGALVLVLVASSGFSQSPSPRDHGMQEGSVATADTGGMPGEGPMMGRCPHCPRSGAMGGQGMGMTGGRGMMGLGLDHMERGDRVFFLDRLEELGLSPEQVTKLRDLRNAVRKEHIRQSAEIRIARMELAEMLQSQWTVAEAEKQARTLQQLQGDMLVSFLRARKAAEDVLTPEQLNMARSQGVEELVE